MSETKHTPGPWEYDCDSGGCYFKLSAGEEAIIDCCDFCSTPTINTEANARLIAAAPDLLEALRLFVNAAYPVTTEVNPRGHAWSEAYLDQSLDNARAAIAKAKGEQP